MLLGSDVLTIETGFLAQRAHGSVVVKYRNNVLLATASYDAIGKKEKSPFAHLNVDFVENFYASGKIPGGFYKREGKPSLNAILTSRVIDRSIRPMLNRDFHQDIHIVITVLSYDESTDISFLGILGASTALLISKIPFDSPVAALGVGIKNSKPCLEFSDTLKLIVTGSKESIIMIEGASTEISEEKILEAVNFAHTEIQKIIDLQKSLAKEISVEKIDTKLFQENINIEPFEKKIYNLQCINNPHYHDEAHKMISDFIEENYAEASSIIRSHAEISCMSAMKSVVRKLIFSTKQRVDGRSLDEIREIGIVLDLLPMVHGSAVFTRGKTQSLGTVTLGSIDDQQLIDSLDEEFSKRFFLHYNFPPYSTGEAGFMRSPGRREMGHGNLAEKAILAVLPDESIFPYTMRVVSDILSSNGSSSMASVCSASLALMSAGVPIKKAVSGIAMGLIIEGNEHVILTDITGFEDGIGDIDLKVAGTYDGVTAIQLDVKTQNLSQSMLIDILAKAKAARMAILRTMDKIISVPKEKVADNVPKYGSILIDKDKISVLIGPSGKNIKAIIEQTSADINIEDDGNVKIFAPDLVSLNETLALIRSLVDDVKLGDQMKAKVKKIIPAGLFLELKRQQDGFLHISEISNKRIENIEDHVQNGDVFNVEVINIDKLTGKIKLKNLDKDKKNNER